MRALHLMVIVTSCSLILAHTKRATAQQTAPAVAPSSAGSLTPVTVLIPKGTIVVVKTTQGYSSYSAKTGAKLRYEVFQDVVINGHVIAKAGDTAQGTVQEGQAGEAGSFGIGYKAANLRVSVDEVYNFCGDTIHVDFDRSEYRRRQGAFGENKDVQIVTGQKYASVTDRVQKVCGEATNESPLPIPSDAIQTSVK